MIGSSCLASFALTLVLQSGAVFGTHLAPLSTAPAPATDTHTAKEARRTAAPAAVASIHLAAAAVEPPTSTMRLAPNTDPIPLPADPIPLPADLEMELARSAPPAHLRAEATIYLWSSEGGYRVAVEGSNGFAALVGRDDPNLRLAPWSYDEWRRDVLVPISFDAAGVETHMQVYLDLGMMRARDVPPAEAQRRIREGFESGRYTAPDRPGIAYMLSPILRGYRDAETNDEIATFLLPHYMFYAPGLTPQDVGATGRDRRHPLMLNRTPNPHGVVIMLAGETETEAWREEHAGMLERLCAIDPAWCHTG